MRSKSEMSILSLSIEDPSSHDGMIRISEKLIPYIPTLPSGVNQKTCVFGDQLYIERGNFFYITIFTCFCRNLKLLKVSSLIKLLFMINWFFNWSYFRTFCILGSLWRGKSSEQIGGTSVLSAGVAQEAGIWTDKLDSVTRCLPNTKSPLVN